MAPPCMNTASSKREIIAIGPASILRCHSATYFRGTYLGMAFLKGHALNVSLVPLVREGPRSFSGRSCMILFHLRLESLSFHLDYLHYLSPRDWKHRW